MNRRSFLGSLSAGALAGTWLGGESRAAEPTQVEVPLVKTPLSLMAPRADGVDAIWAVTELSLGRLEWKSDDGSEGQAAVDAFGFVPQGSKLLRVRVSGLKPGTQYRVRSVTTAAKDGRTEMSEWKSFRTLNPAGDSTQFVVWNDTHIHDATIEQLHKATPNADFFIWNGDTCNDWTSEDLLIPTLLHPGRCDITENRPLMMVWGNHDVRGKHAFEMPQMVATPNGRPFYAFRSGPVAAICLHTGEDKPDSHPSFGGRVAFDVLRKEQAIWLEESIRRPEIASAPYRIVFCHIPLCWLDESVQDYAKGGFDRHSGRSREAWHHALVDWKAQLIISGHTHRTAWLPASDAFPYGQLVGGGPQLKSATWMEGKAAPGGCEIRVVGLDGSVRHEVKLAPLV